MSNFNSHNKMDNQFLSFDTAKVQTLTLDQLARTQLEKDVYGHPLRGIYHFALTNQILDLCKEQGYNTEVYDLFAAQNKERQTPGVVLIPELEKQYGERATEAHLLRRVFANIRITDFDDDAHTTCLAVAFHQKGIQVGFGNNVKICHNQCMLGREHYIATYSEGGNGRRAKEDRIEIIGDVGSLSFSVFTYAPIVLHTAEGRHEFAPVNPPCVQEPLIKLVVDHLLGRAICTCDSISATSVNWVVDRVLNKL